MIIPYLINIINNHKAHGKLRVHSCNKVIDHKTPGEWKIQLSRAINFFSSKDYDKIRNIHTKNDNMDILMGSETYNIIKELFKSFLQRFQERLEESVRKSEFIIDGVILLESKLNKINTGNVGSYIDSPKWLKK